MITTHCYHWLRHHREVLNSFDSLPVKTVYYHFKTKAAFLLVLNPYIIKVIDEQVYLINPFSYENSPNDVTMMSHMGVYQDSVTPWIGVLR